jgi:hypothetical protein
MIKSRLLRKKEKKEKSFIFLFSFLVRTRMLNITFYAHCRCRRWRVTNRLKADASSEFCAQLGRQKDGMQVTM